jgi:hypothetical protein
LRIILVKDRLTVKNHKLPSLLLVILLVFTTTSQAAAAYVMSCQGTASCCCIVPQPDMEMNDAMPGEMDQNCCTTGPSDSCDFETASHAAAEPFLSSFVNGSVDRHMAMGLTARVVDPEGVALNLARHSENFTDRDGPPIYLQTQHFLC